MSARVFTIKAGAPFLATLARALLSGELVPGFPSGGPLDLSRATIYLPTQRAAAAFARELVAASGAPSLLLPRIAPLGAFEPAESLIETDPPPPSFDDRPAVGELTRRMILARMTRAWGEALRGAIRRAGPDGLIVDAAEPALVAASPAQAFALAGDLAALIDDMIIEGVDWSRLATLAADDFDPYWRITLDFLKIAMESWPKWLTENGLIDGAARASMAVDREIARLQAGGARNPTIIAGSTGSVRATARLIGAIARDPLGAVVLPDLDLDLDDPSFDVIGVSGEGGDETAGHPQAALKRLLASMRLDRAEVRQLGLAKAALTARSAFLSEALRPAQTTHVWLQRRESLNPASLQAGLADVHLIVAETEAEEALALAAALRETLETPGKTAALITPDPSIARRVSAELARWNINVENSAGRTLGDTGAGALGRLALAAALDFAPRPLAALLQHPDVRLSRTAEAYARDARALDLGVLRVPLPLPGLDAPARALAAGRQAAREPFAHRAAAALVNEDFEAAGRLLLDVTDALGPLRALGPRAALSHYIAAHRHALKALTAPGEFAASAAGAALDDLLQEWSTAAEEAFGCSLSDYAALFDQMAMATRAPPERASHPRLAILGLLEARLLRFDRLLLAGLDETVWPPAAETDAFLNRPMREQLGLSSPERRIGQTAHDFVSAMGAGEVILSRARKRGTSPTVASRFLQRMGAVAGEAAMQGLEARGAVYLAIAHRLDQPDVTPPISRPEPRPRLELRPRRLSVTRIETLRRDPYAIYASQILKLAPLTPVGPEMGPREIGNIWHAALQKFSLGGPLGEPYDAARARLRAIAQVDFAPLLADPAFRALRWPRILAALDAFLEFDEGRRALAREVLVERAGALEIPLGVTDPFTLSARADRIDLLTDGGAALIDYKTGAAPSEKMVMAGWSPQLTLEAAMLKRGAFRGAPEIEADTAIYFKIGGADGGAARQLKFKDSSLQETAEKHFAELRTLLLQFADEKTPYLSRPYPQFLARGGEYDHLARVAEWAAAGGDGEAGEET